MRWPESEIDEVNAQVEGSKQRMRAKDRVSGKPQVRGEGRGTEEDKCTRPLKEVGACPRKWRRGTKVGRKSCAQNGTCVRLMKPQVGQTNRLSVAAWDVWTVGSKNKCDAHFGAWVHKAWRARSCKGKGTRGRPKEGVWDRCQGPEVMSRAPFPRRVRKKVAHMVAHSV